MPRPRCLVPLSLQADSPTNPLNIMRAIYQPGDYIAFKLDIGEGPF